jgi:hypothetical protein
MTAEGWTIPEGYNNAGEVTKCRSCKAEIRWTVSKRGKFAPLNRDGTSHFANCPQAATWRKPR